MFKIWYTYQITINNIFIHNKTIKIFSINLSPLLWKLDNIFSEIDGKNISIKSTEHKAMHLIFNKIIINIKSKKFEKKVIIILP